MATSILTGPTTYSTRSSSFSLHPPQPQQAEPFDKDYMKAISALKKAEDAVAKTSIHNHFILPGNRMVLNFKLFEDRVSQRLIFIYGILH